jgi:hypothetical protein
MGIVVAPGAGEYDDGEAKRHFCARYTTPGTVCNTLTGASVQAFGHLKEEHPT